MCVLSRLTQKITLGARDVSCAVSCFGQFTVTSLTQGKGDLQ